MTIQLGTIALSTAQESMQALATEWESLGLKVKQTSWPLSGLIAAFEANGGKTWQSMVQTAGAYDPAGGVGVGFRFNSHSPFSGVHDPKLDTLLQTRRAPRTCPPGAASTTRRRPTSPRTTTGRSTSRFAPANISVHGVGGPGLTTPLASVAVVPTIPWEDVYYNPSGS